MKNKKLFTTLAALTVGSVISTSVIFAPALALANEDEHGEHGCDGEKECSGEKDKHDHDGEHTPAPAKH